MNVRPSGNCCPSVNGLLVVGGSGQRRRPVDGQSIVDDHIHAGHCETPLAGGHEKAMPIDATEVKRDLVRVSPESHLMPFRPSEASWCLRRPSPPSPPFGCRHPGGDYDLAIGQQRKNVSLLEGGATSGHSSSGPRLHSCKRFSRSVNVSQTGNNALAGSRWALSWSQ